MRYAVIVSIVAAARQTKGIRDTEWEQYGDDRRERKGEEAEEEREGDERIKKEKRKGIEWWKRNDRKDTTREQGEGGEGENCLQANYE